jgi:outer membrane receptor protein involved in Fe transport
LRLGLENVFDKTYKTHGSGVYAPGRNFYLEYAYRL